MNRKNWLVSSIGVFIVIFALDFLIHGMLLKGVYEQTASVWRTQEAMKQFCWFMWIWYAVFALVFTLIFSKGYEVGKGGVGQGIRFGFLIGLLFGVPAVCVWFVVLPIPFGLALVWLGADLVECIAAGVVAGALYRK